MKSRKNNIFETVMMKAPSTSSFDLSHDRKMSMDMGTLTPSLCVEVLPGDRWSISSENMLRFAPLISPVMHRIDVTTHYFFVPNRILWSEWEDFITGTSDVEPPYINGLYPDTQPSLALPPNGWRTGSIADYLGIPPSSVNNAAQKISLLPTAAYYKIYDEYYRDQNLIDEKFEPLVAGYNTAYLDKILAPPLKRAWEHDYYTSCLPFAQKGDEVTIPLLQDNAVDVTYKTGIEVPQTVRKWGSSDAIVPDGNLGSSPFGSLRNLADGLNANIDLSGTHEVEINSEAASINTLRRAFRLQEFLERAARGGTRYVEALKSHFGVTSSDKRLQRPEYIHGSKQHMTISEVLSTAQTIDQDSNDIPVGNMAGHGISVGGGNRGTYVAEEHGWIIGIINVQPKTAYQQGLHKQFTRMDRFDYAFPEFANIGEQEVKVSELRNDVGTTEQLDATFGYIPRYSEYKFMNSQVCGDMRDTLQYWHAGRVWEGATLPALNEEFIECNPTKRIFAVTDENIHSIYCHIFNNCKTVRKLPRYGIPTI